MKKMTFVLLLVCMSFCLAKGVWASPVDLPEPLAPPLPCQIEFASESSAFLVVNQDTTGVNCTKLPEDNKDQKFYTILDCALSDENEHELYGFNSTSSWGTVLTTASDCRVEKILEETGNLENSYNLYQNSRVFFFQSYRTPVENADAAEALGSDFSKNDAGQYAILKTKLTKTSFDANAIKPIYFLGNMVLFTKNCFGRDCETVTSPEATWHQELLADNQEPVAGIFNKNNSDKWEKHGDPIIFTAKYRKWLKAPIEGKKGGTTIYIKNGNKVVMRDLDLKNVKIVVEKDAVLEMDRCNLSADSNVTGYLIEVKEGGTFLPGSNGDQKIKFSCDKMCHLSGYLKQEKFTNTAGFSLKGLPAMVSYSALLERVLFNKPPSYFDEDSADKFRPFEGKNEEGEPKYFCKRSTYSNITTCELSKDAKAGTWGLIPDEAYTYYQAFNCKTAPSNPTNAYYVINVGAFIYNVKITNFEGDDVSTPKCGGHGKKVLGKCVCDFTFTPTNDGANCACEGDGKSIYKWMNAAGAEVDICGCEGDNFSEFQDFLNSSHSCVAESSCNEPKLIKTNKTLYYTNLCGCLAGQEYDKILKKCTTVTGGQPGGGGRPGGDTTCLNGTLKNNTCSCTDPIHFVAVSIRSDTSNCICKHGSSDTNGKCKSCATGELNVVKGICVQCSEKGAHFVDKDGGGCECEGLFEASGDKCVCDEAKGKILSGGNCVCNEAKGFEPANDFCISKEIKEKCDSKFRDILEDGTCGGCVESYQEDQANVGGDCVPLPPKVECQSGYSWDDATAKCAKDCYELNRMAGEDAESCGECVNGYFESNGNCIVFEELTEEEQQTITEEQEKQLKKDQNKIPEADAAGGCGCVIGEGSIPLQSGISFLLLAAGLGIIRIARKFID